MNKPLTMNQSVYVAGEDDYGTVVGYDECSVNVAMPDGVIVSAAWEQIAVTESES